MRKLLMIFTMIITLSFSNSFASNQEITLAINGSSIYTDVNPVAINNRTLVPIRAVSEHLGANVGWISEFQEITLNFNKEKIVIKMNLNSNIIEKNGQPYEIDVSPQAINNRTMVPIRFISEMLGYEVLWEASSNTVNIIAKELEELNQKVIFEDKELEDIIRQEIKKPKGDLYKSDVEGIKTLYPAFNTIESLKGIEHLTNLKVLEVHKNNIRDLSPISNLKNLKVLSISDNPISDISPLKKLTNLEDLQMFRIKTSNISHVKDLTNLIHLKISCNNITNIDALTNLTRLESLAIAENEIVDISNLSKLTRLRELHLNKNQIKNIDVIRHLKKLEELYISDNPLGNLQPLSNLENLEFLFIPEERVGELRPFKNLSNTNINILPDW